MTTVKLFYIILLTCEYNGITFINFSMNFVLTTTAKEDKLIKKTVLLPITIQLQTHYQLFFRKIILIYIFCYY